MQPQPNHRHPSGPSGLSGGYSLIEVIGVLAVLAFLAAAIIPTLIKRTDYTVVTTEQANLATFTNALALQVVRSNNIPSQANWAAALAGWVSLAPNSVVTNARNNARAYLIDTSGWLNSTGYTQTATGSATVPVNVRVMFVSSVGLALPAGLVSSTPLGASDFNNLWNTTPGTVPAGGAWSGWTGNANDVVVQRFDLQSFFCQLILVNRSTNANIKYSINNSSSMGVPNGTLVNASYVAGTQVILSSNTVVQTRYLLSQNSCSVFDGGEWSRQIAYGSAAPLNTNVLGTVFYLAASSFRSAGLNPHVTSKHGSDQAAVLAAFNYLMTSYTLWSVDSYPTYGQSQMKHLPISILLKDAGKCIDKYLGTSADGLLTTP